MPIPRKLGHLTLIGLCTLLPSCSSFLSRGPDNAGGEVAKGGPFVGSRFAYNSLYAEREGRPNHLPKKILSPVILVTDGGASAIADVFMLPWDWNGSTVPPAKPDPSINSENHTGLNVRERYQRKAESHGYQL